MVVLGGVVHELQQLLYRGLTTICRIHHRAEYFASLDAYLGRFIKESNVHSLDDLFGDLVATK